MPASTIAIAARSFTLPPGFAHSAFPSNSTPSNSAATPSSRTSGVFPIRSSSPVPNFGRNFAFAFASALGIRSLLSLTTMLVL